MDTLCPCKNYLDVQDKLACQQIMQEGYLGIQVNNNPKNFYVDTTKNLCPDQSADILELQDGCQNDLVHRENKKVVTGKTTPVETSVIKGLARNYEAEEAEEEEEEEHDYSYIDEDIIENIRKVFHGTSTRNKHALSEGRRDI